MEVEKDARAHKPRSFWSIREGDYTLETYLRFTTFDEKTYSIAGKRILQEDMHLVLSKNKGIYPAFLDYDSYVEGYLKAFSHLSLDKKLTINDSGFAVVETGRLQLASVARALLSRMDREQAFLLPGYSYMVDSDILTTNNSVSVRLFYHPGEETKAIVLHAFVEPISAEENVSPYALRLKNFFQTRVGLSLTAQSPMRVILDATHMNSIFELLHADIEQPIFKKGEVYVLDKVTESGGNDVCLRYHNFNLESKFASLLRRNTEEITMEDVMYLRKHQDTLRIETFSDQSGVEGRMQQDIKYFFKEHIDRGAVLFSPINDLYMNSLDYMKSPLADKRLPQMFLFKLYPDYRNDDKSEKLYENVRMLRASALTPRSEGKNYMVYGNRHEIKMFPKRVP